MIIQKNCEFVTNISGPITSPIFANGVGDILSLQVSGSNGEYYIEGRNNRKGDWCPLAAINVGDLTVARNGIVKPGLYEVGIIGARELRVRVVSTEGFVSIFGQIISSEEV